jgi:vacuolar protein sorting-associated protein 54
MIAHPSSSADPLRGSRKPLPPAPTGAKSLLKAPPAVLFDEYLGHLLTNETSNADEENVATPWHQFRDAGGLDDVDSAYSARNTRSSGVPESLAIPDVFLTTGFDLTNPAVWAQIVEGEDADRIEETSSNLTQYVDHLEAHLVYEISQRAPMFFSALTNLQALAAESATCLSRIESLQYKLSLLDQTTTMSGIDCAVNYALVDIKKALAKGLRSIQGIATATNLANEMLQHGDWGGALDALIHIAEWWIDHGRTKALEMPAQPELLCTEDRRLLDNIVEETENENETEADVSILGQSLHAIEDALPLHQIPAVQKIPGQMLSLLETLKAQVESEIQAQLSRALANENEIGTYPYGTQKLNADLVKLLEAHLRCGGASSAITQIWQACSFRAVRDSLRQVRNLCGDYVP